MENQKTSIFSLSDYVSPLGNWETQDKAPSKYNVKQARALTNKRYTPDQETNITDDGKPKLVSDKGGYLLKGNYLKNGIIWKGFRHQWLLTNHRTNRLGSLIVPETDYNEQGNHNAPAERVQIIHTGASGTASDVLRHYDYFTEVKSDDTVFYSGVAEQHITGKSGEVTDLIFQIEGPIDPAMDPDFINGAKVFLNGFDIFCNYGGRARKLLLLDIDTSTVIVSKNASNTQFSFQVSGKIKLECRSDECRKLNDETKVTLWQFDYTVRLAYLLVGGADFRSTPLAGSATAPDDYNENVIQETDTEEEVYSILDQVVPGGTGKVQGADFYTIKLSDPLQSSCTAIHRIRYENHAVDHNSKLGVTIATPKRHAYAHMLEYDFAVHGEEVLDGDQLRIDRSLFFKNWHKGIENITFGEFFRIIGKKKIMKQPWWQIKNNNHGSMLSFRTGGTFEMEMGLSLLTFGENAEVSPLQSTEALYGQDLNRNLTQRLERENFYQDKLMAHKSWVAESLIERYYQPEERRPLIVWAALDTPCDGIYAKGTSCQLPEPLNLPMEEGVEHEKPFGCDVSVPINSVLYELGG